MVNHEQFNSDTENKNTNNAPLENYQQLGQKVGVVYTESAPQPPSAEEVKTAYEDIRIIAKSLMFIAQMGKRDNSPTFCDYVLKHADFVQKFEENIKAGYYQETDNFQSAKQNLELIIRHKFDKLLATTDFTQEKENHKLRDFVFNNTNPYILVDIAQKYPTFTNEVIGGPDQLVDYLHQGLEKSDKREHDISFFANNAETLKEAGASDESILKYIDRLSSADFADGITSGFGKKLISAGLSTDAIADKLFCMDDKNLDSQIEALQDAGFNMNQIAKSYLPDDIGKNIRTFVDYGADPKELAAYLAGMRMEKTDNPSDKDSYLKQTYLIYDKDHKNPRSISIPKWRLDYNTLPGYACLAPNIRDFADEGVELDDFIDQLPKDQLNPSSMMVGLLEYSGRFDMDEVMNRIQQKANETE